MQITVDLLPDTEARLRAFAVRHDADGVRRVLADALAPTVNALLNRAPAGPTAAEFKTLADELADSLAASRELGSPPLADHAVSRAGIYFLRYAPEGIVAVDPQTVAAM